MITVEQGLDPRDFAMIAMGGAGPTHAVEIAEALGIRRVIVPLHPGLTSAFGALVANVRVDMVNSVRLTNTSPAAVVGASFDALEARALESFEAQGGFAHGYRVERFIAMRYEGQNYEQEMPVGSGAISPERLDSVLADYHNLYYDFYGYRLDRMPVEFVRLGVTVTADGTGELPTLSLEVRGRAAAKNPPAARTAEVYFGDGGFRTTTVMPRTDLTTHRQLAGPIIVESMDSTIVVPPGWRLEADSAGMVELHKDDSSTDFANTSSVTTAHRERIRGALL
jgi:N-methylhydantoinase A